jgi:hypothetical protein
MRRLRAVLKLLLRCFGFRCRAIDYPELPAQQIRAEPSHQGGD